MKYYFTQDNDCNWFIVPLDKRSEFDKYLEDLEDGLYPDYPDGAETIDRPDCYSFESVEEIE